MSHFTVTCSDCSVSHVCIFMIKRGETSLHIAALCHKSKVARLLIDAGCSCKRKNKVAPWHFAHLTSAPALDMAFVYWSCGDTLEVLNSNGLICISYAELSLAMGPIIWFWLACCKTYATSYFLYGLFTSKCVLILCCPLYGPYRSAH